MSSINKGFRLHLSHLEMRMRQSGHYSSTDPLTQPIFIALLTEKILGLNIAAAKEDIRRFIRNPRELDGWSAAFFMSLLSQIQFS